jgi:GAF domain-containing protein
MPARILAHVPDLAVSVRSCADGEVLVLGRANDCELTLPHESVSRRHARLTVQADGTALVEDLGSKNGLRVDGARVARAVLSARQWFAIGDVYCEFQPLQADDLARADLRADTLRRSSAQWSARLSRARHGDELMGALLGGMVELAECRRGFVLVAQGREAPRVRACFGISPEEIAGGGFSGSRGALDRCMTLRRPVFLTDQRDRAFLKGQASVVRQGIRALACLPLLDGANLLGAVYVDTDDDAKVFTELDADLMAAFAEQAAAALALSGLEADLDRLALQLADSGRPPVAS